MPDVASSASSFVHTICIWMHNLHNLHCCFVVFFFCKQYTAYPRNMHMVLLCLFSLCFNHVLRIYIEAYDCPKASESTLKKQVTVPHMCGPVTCFFRVISLAFGQSYACPSGSGGHHFNDVIMSAMASQITGLTIVYSTVSGADQWKHQSSVSLAFVKGIHRRPVISPHKGPITRKMFPFDDVIVILNRSLLNHTETRKSANMCTIIEI